VALGFPGSSGLIYSSDFGGLDLSCRSGDRQLRFSGSRVGYFEPKRVEELGRLVGPAVGCWAPSPCG
jgi:hypothetical protein